MLASRRWRVPAVSFYVTYNREKDFLFSLPGRTSCRMLCGAYNRNAGLGIDDSGKHASVHAARVHVDSEERGARACMTRKGIIPGARVE